MGFFLWEVVFSLLFVIDAFISFPLIGDRGVTIHSAHETRRDMILGSRDQDEILTLSLRKLQWGNIWNSQNGNWIEMF